MPSLPTISVPNGVATPQDSVRSSVVPVIAGSVGIGIATAMISGVTGLSDDRAVAGASLYSAGVGLGAVLGAHFGRREPAALHTMLGAAVGALPLILRVRGLEDDEVDVELGLTVLSLSLLLC